MAIRPRARGQSQADYDSYAKSQEKESQADQSENQNAASNVITNANVANVGGIPRDRDTGRYVGPFSSAYEHSEALAGDMGNSAQTTAVQATHSAGLRNLGGLDRDTSIFGKNAGIGSLFGMDPQYSDAMLNPLVGYKPQSVLRSEILAEEQRKAANAELFKDGIPSILDIFKNILGTGGEIIKDIPQALKDAYGDFRMGLEGFSFDPERQKEKLLDPEAKKSLGFAELSDNQYEEKVNDFIQRSQDASVRNRFNEMISGRSAKPEPMLPNAFEEEDVVEEDPNDEGFYPDDLLVAKPVDESALSPYTQVDLVGTDPVVSPLLPLLPRDGSNDVRRLLPIDNINIFDRA